MISYHFSVYQYIIKENDDALAQAWLKQLIHRHLEGGGHIAQSKRHYPKLIMSVMSTTHRLTDISFAHQDLMVSLHQI